MHGRGVWCMVEVFGAWERCGVHSRGVGGMVKVWGAW